MTNKTRNLTAAATVLARIAAFTKDGEMLDGEKFDLSADAAFDDLHACIDLARGAIIEQPAPAALRRADAESAAYVKRAVKIWSNDEIDIDGLPAVSLAEDGAWVAAWVWVAA